MLAGGEVMTLNLLLLFLPSSFFLDRRRVAWGEQSPGIRQWK